jgi:uncharacterized protein with PIN domain
MTRKKMRKKEETAVEPRFIADCMLGTLAKRLRLMGYDTLFFNRIEDAELVETAVREDRIILTRDSGLLRRKAARKSIFVDSDNLEAQLNKVIRECGLRSDEDKLMSRCLICNTRLISLNKKEVIGKVPPFIFLKHSRFNYCGECNKIYWKGSHLKNTEKIKNIIRDKTEDGKNI